MNSKFLKLLTAILVIVVLVIGATLALAEDKAPAAEAKKPTYVGSKGCKMCHQSDAQGKQFGIWLASKHAQSLKALDPAKGEDKNEKCLKCHTTGYGEGGYALDVAAEKAMPEVFGAVGCEACHGPGSEYKAGTVMKDKAAAVKAGLVIPDEKVCVKCHNAESPTFKGFKFDEMVAKIAHMKPAVKEAPKPAEGGK
jgi:hypothetical protein